MALSGARAESRPGCGGCWSWKKTRPSLMSASSGIPRRRRSSVRSKTAEEGGGERSLRGMMRCPHAFLRGGSREEAGGRAEGEGEAAKSTDVETKRLCTSCL